MIKSNAGILPFANSQVPQQRSSEVKNKRRISSQQKHAIRMETSNLNIDGLPSNKLKDELLKDSNFAEVKKEGALDEKEANGIPLLTQFNQKVTMNYHHCKKNRSSNGDLKCCRDINYYLDLIMALIKFSNSTEVHKESLIHLVEDNWKSRFGKTDYDCERKLDEESIRKRCILKQLYDYCDDRNHIEREELQYNAYLNTKWEKIFSYTNSNNKYLYYNITYKNNNKKVNYKDLLLNTADLTFINCVDLKNHDITFSDTKTINEVEDSVSVPLPGVHPVAGAEASRNSVPRGEAHRGNAEPSSNLGAIDVNLRKDFAGDAQPGLAEGAEKADVTDGAEPGSPLWGTPLSAGFSVAGFSPVGPWLSTLIRKDSTVRKDIYEDESLLFLNHPEHSEHYISYHSFSH
ncbi:hypothetical protein POVCU1_062520 [Plasmodium ovale curtisi]|uniref:PIR Superfamily Protein n=1 Tax=Plasmodium ovale curtisi TaxID=864141 RepID=A0A1A8X969_PLAOA|nr:hypothetical protein POVCU1_062520 [Plasmodium ovale curtisi]